MADAGTVVAKWQAMIVEVNAIGAPPPPPPPPPTPVIAVGARVKMVAGPKKIFSSPSLSAPVLGQQPLNAQGVVVSGPVLADGGTWWNVNFDSGIDGWVWGTNLVAI